MYSVTLRKLGGSVILTLPKAWLKQVGLDAGSDVALYIVDNKLMVEPVSRPVYKLSDLVEEYRTEQDECSTDSDWLDDDAAGEEQL
jgi:antitoxin ChpS